MDLISIKYTLSSNYFFSHLFYVSPLIGSSLLLKNLGSLTRRQTICKYVCNMPVGNNVLEKHKIQMRKSKEYNQE